MSLETLKTEIDNIGTQIRDLKSSGGGDVGSLVAKLNLLKKEYADNNAGIGVDGKPYQAPLSKADKKKLEKEKKAATQNKESEVSRRESFQLVCLFLSSPPSLKLAKNLHNRLPLPKTLRKSLSRMIPSKLPRVDLQQQRQLQPVQVPNPLDLPFKSSRCKWSSIQMFLLRNVQWWL